MGIHLTQLSIICINLYKNWEKAYIWDFNFEKWSKIRQLAHTHLINSVELTCKSNYDVLKNNLLDYFGRKTTLEFRQQSFMRSLMTDREIINQYRPRVRMLQWNFWGKLTIQILKKKINQIEGNFLKEQFAEYEAAIITLHRTVTIRTGTTKTQCFLQLFSC